MLHIFFCTVFCELLRNFCDSDLVAYIEAECRYIHTGFRVTPSRCATSGQGTCRLIGTTGHTINSISCGHITANFFVASPHCPPEVAVKVLYLHQQHRVRTSIFIALCVRYMVIAAQQSCLTCEVNASLQHDVVYVRRFTNFLVS